MEDFYTHKKPAILEQSQAKEKHMILSAIKITIPSQKRGEALKILRSVAELWKDDPGCLGCHIYQEIQEDNVLMFEEMWRTEEALERHLRSREYRNLLLVLEMAIKKPEIRFYTISSSTGIETIEKARSHGR